MVLLLLLLVLLLLLLLLSYYYPGPYDINGPGPFILYYESTRGLAEKRRTHNH